MPKAFYNGIELKPLDMPVGYSGRPVLAFVTDFDGKEFNKVTPILISSKKDHLDRFICPNGTSYTYAYQLPEDFQFTTTPDKPKKIPHTYKDLRDKIVLDNRGQYGQWVSWCKDFEWSEPVQKSGNIIKFCSTWEQADSGKWTDIIFTEDCE